MLLARAVAARLLTRLVDVQAARGSASVVLTGGGIGMATLEALRESPAVNAIEWDRLDVWWGDERFVPADDNERNERQARSGAARSRPRRSGPDLSDGCLGRTGRRTGGRRRALRGTAAPARRT